MAGQSDTPPPLEATLNAVTIPLEFRGLSSSALQYVLPPVSRVLNEAHSLARLSQKANQDEIPIETARFTLLIMQKKKARPVLLKF